MALIVKCLLEYDVMRNGESNRFCAECCRLIENV